MRMELTQHITYGSSGLYELGLTVEPKLAHGINDSPLYRFKPVANVWQCSVVDDVHRIIKIRTLGVQRQRHGLLICGLDIFIHGGLPIQFCVASAYAIDA